MRTSKEAANTITHIFRSKDLRRVLPWLLIASLFANVLALALPLAILQILDRVLRNQSVETLIFLTIGVLIALFLEQVLRWVNGSITNWLAARFKHQTGYTAFQTLMNVPMKRYQQESPSTHLERMQSIPQIADFYSGQALLVLFDLPFILLFLVLIYFIGGMLVLVPLVLLLLFGAIILLFGQTMNVQSRQWDTYEGQRLGFLHELFSGIVLVKSLLMESLLLRQYEKFKETGARQNESISYANALASGLGGVISHIMIVAVVFFGAWQVTKGAMTPGSLAACMMLSVRALQPLRKGLSIWIKFQSFSVANRKLQTVMDLADLPHRLPDLPPLRGSLAMADVSVQADAGRTILTGVALSLKRGECIALAGDSGSGKSRLLRLLCGLDDLEHGQITADGKPLADFNADSVARRIAYLPQSGKVVEGAILDNLTGFNDDHQDAALALADTLGLSDLVARLRHGYDTQVGENDGENIPAGIRQLIAIVRALVHQPDIILFDETNIALDRERDEKLLNYLSAIKGTTAIVLVSHRPSYLALAERGYVIQQGRLLPADATTLVKQQEAQALTEAQLRQRPAGFRSFVAIQRHLDSKSSDLSRCLLPLLKALNWRGKPWHFVQAWPYRDSDADLSSVLNTLAHLGFTPIRLGQTRGAIDPQLLPCLFVPRNHPALILLAQHDDGSLQVFHSQHNTVTDLPKLPCKGEVYAFEKQPPPEEASTGNWVSELLSRFKIHLLVAFFVTFLATALSLAPPLFVRSFYDVVLPTGEIGGGVYLLIGVAIAIALSGWMTHYRSRIIAFIGGRLEYLVGAQLLKQVLSLPPQAITGGSVSRQVSRIKSLERLRDIATGPLATVVLELPATLLILLVLVLINPWGASVLVVSALVFILLAVSVSSASLRSVNQGSKNTSRQSVFVNESLESMTTLRSSGNRAHWLNRYREFSGSGTTAEFREQQTQLKISELGQFLGGTTGILVLSITAYASILGNLTGGTLMATMMLTWRLISPMQSLLMSMGSWSRIRSSTDQLNRLMRLKPESSALRRSYRPAFQGDLELARVSYRYSNDGDPVIENISFTASPGELLAIAGPSGSGKSTLLKLMGQICTPQSGAVKIDGITTAQLPVTELREEISYMPQHCHIFQATIRENLACAYSPANQEEIVWACQMAGLHEDILTLPEGYDTLVNTQQALHLPYGFKQRLSLARTLLKPAKWVLLDEPGSGMNAAGEAALSRCIQYLRKNAVVILVSHRPTHLQKADRILYMEEGKLIAMGSYTDLETQLTHGWRG